MSAIGAPVEHAPVEADIRGAWDGWLIGAAAVLAGLGLLMILSASSAEADAAYGDATRFVTRQGLGLLLGCVGALAVLWVPWVWLRQGGLPVYIASLLGLAAVLTPLGHGANGAVRWIDLGGLHFQPSELAKVGLVMVLAHYLAANEGRMRDLIGTVVPTFGLALLPAVLVMLEPDFGTTVVLCGLLLVMLFVAGLQKRWLAVGGAVVATSLVVLLLVAPYRVRRLAVFMDPYSDASDAGYQVVQGWIAMANGGLWGQGIGGGVAQSGFLPEAHTDAIAAVVGEELGAMGWILLVGAYGVVVWRGMRIATRASDLYGVLLAAGVTTLIAAQVVINLGVVVGWVPNKGLVLPLLSYGASAAMIHIVCIAVLQRVGFQAAADPDRGDR